MGFFQSIFLHYGPDYQIHLLVTTTTIVDMCLCWHNALGCTSLEIYLWTVSHHQTLTDPISRRAIFFFGGSGSTSSPEVCGAGSLFFSISLSFCHTSPLSVLGRHLSSLNLGSRAVATFNHHRFELSFHPLRSLGNVALKCNMYVGRVNIRDLHCAQEMT